MQNPSAPTIFLASSSPYRHGLLNRFLDSYKTVIPNIDESNDQCLLPSDLAPYLARKKAEIVAKDIQNALIIGADQIAVLDGQILGKPNNHQKALKQLLAASGKDITFLTAVCMLDSISHARYEYTNTTKVRFRQFNQSLAEAYLQLDKPYDCAGSFKLEGAGFVLFDSVKTDDPTALIGLPMIWIADQLLKLGYLTA
ncbi:MAG: Maf family nucleotide pyrophosphatase [Woeseiaceae bacterium]|nr:Maf family nucleotide pyrophosphatase [Woeseiaceae bacterium]